MSMIKNKSTLYAIVRRDNEYNTDTICCFTKTLENAERLSNEYEQQWLDIDPFANGHYYPVANIFYDE